jgi:hypothetical protein
MLAATASAAPIALTGSMHYTQDFDILDTETNTFTSTTTWADDGTIPGWYLYKAANTAPTPPGLVGSAYTYRVSNGMPGQGNANGLVDTGHFYSIGALGNTDRALGAVPVTGQGEHSIIAVFHNTSTAGITLQNIAYNAEIRRTNQTANVVETIAIWWKKGSDPAAFFTNTTATATTTNWPANLSTGPSGPYVTGWNRAAEADFTTTSGAQQNTQVDVSTPVNAAVLSQIKLDPGEYLALRWGNINDSGADALMGIDDVDLTFASDADAIGGTVTNIVRHDAGTTRDPADDSVSFDLTVNGAGAAGPGWMITAPPALAGTTGAFGVPVGIPAQPIASFTGAAHVLSLSVADQANQAVTAPVQVVAPWCTLIPAPAADFTYLDQGTASTTDDQVTFTVSVDGTFTGTGFDIKVAGLPGEPIASGIYATPFTLTSIAPGTYTSFVFTDRADPTSTATLDVFPPAIIGTNATTLSPGPLFSQPAGQNGAIRWTVNAAAGTIRQNGNPTQDDHVLLSEVVDLSAVNETVEFSATLVADTTTGTSGFEAPDFFTLDLIIDGGAPVSALGDADTDSDGKLSGTVELQTTFGAGATRTFNFSQLIPPAASSVQLRINGNTNSSGETLLLSAVSLAIPQPEITLSAASNIIRDPHGPGAADDTVSFEVTVTGINGGTGWVTTNAAPASGAFGPVTLTVPAGSDSATVRISDNTYPAAFADVVVPLPGPYLIGSLDLGAGSVPVFTDESTPPETGWTINAGIISMANGDAVLPGNKSVTSEVIDLSAATGPVNFSAVLHVRDTSGGFEAADNFLAVLIYDGDTANPVNLITAYDTDGLGTMNGAELATALLVTDYSLSAVIPEGVNSVQLIVTGLVDSDTNEFMNVNSIRFAIGAPDTDGDGMSDAYEDDNGLDKNNPADRDLDADGDGQSNYLEFEAGTASDDADSRFHITGGTFDAATGAAVTTWASVPGKRYRLQFSADLTAWTDSGGIITATSDSTFVSYTVPGAPLTGTGFVRIRVVP